jgi:TRAP-type C4-dicarboxylate transport system permease small subunit
MKILYKIEKYFIVISFALMALIVFFQVLNRFFFKIPIMWPEELARYLMIWMSFVAAAVAFRKGAHIGVNIIIDKLSGKTKQVFIILQSVLIMVFVAVVGYYAIFIIRLQLSTIQLSPALEINLAYIYMAIPVWALLTFIEIFVSLFKKEPTIK